jgi:hypothetical protein
VASDTIQPVWETLCELPERTPREAILMIRKNKKLSDSELKDRVQQLDMWIEEGRKYPNNYRNIQTISDLSSDLVRDLMLDRAARTTEIKELTSELKRLKAELAEIDPV